MILLLSSALAFEPVLESLEDGAVDWTNLRLVVHAAGGKTGTMTNLETAEGDARELLEPRVLRLARAVRVDHSRLAGALLDAGDAVADRLDSNLSLWEVFEARYLSSGGVELDAALSLQAWLRPALVTFAHTPERPPIPGGASGLILDARGLDVKCALAPELVDEAGGHVFGIGDMTAYAASQHGPVLYVGDPADVVAARRAGATPLFLRAESISQGTDFVLSAASAGELRSAAETSDFLLHGKVVVVVGGDPAGSDPVVRDPVVRDPVVRDPVVK